MSLSIDIPAPLADDPDSVITALEMAAVFAGRGDAVEALRWLKRAAESSGETGDDMRTLILARTAADLTTQLQSSGIATRSGPPALPSQDPTSTPTPMPTTTKTPASAATETPRSGAPSLLQPSRPADAAKISPIVQVSDRAPSEAAPSAQATQPSQRWLPKPPPRVTASAGAERTTTRPPPPSSRPMTTPPAPMVEARSVGARELHGNSVPPTARESALPGLDTLTPARDTLASPIPASIIGALAQAAAPRNGVNGERRPLSRGTRPSARIEPMDTEPRLRQAARVSVVRSSTDRGLYLVRVIEDGKAVPADATEALLVLVDPDSTVFSR